MLERLKRFLFWRDPVPHQPEIKKLPGRYNGLTSAKNRKALQDAHERLRKHGIRLE